MSSDAGYAFARDREYDGEAARERQTRRLLQSFIDNPGPGHSGLREAFTVDGAAFYQVTRAQYEHLMTGASSRIRALNTPEKRTAAGPGNDVTITLSSPEIPETGPRVRDAFDDVMEETGPPPSGIGGVPAWLPFRAVQDPRDWSWPELGDGWAVTEILAAIRIVDYHLDEAAPEIFRLDHPASQLLNMYRRISAGPASEGQEAVDTLNLATGGNPRKGVQGDMNTILEELGDGAVANLLAIQSLTKDTDRTWTVFTAALRKALARVPYERPDPS